MNKIRGKKQKWIKFPFHQFSVAFHQNKLFLRNEFQMNSSDFQFLLNCRKFDRLKSNFFACHSRYKKVKKNLQKQIWIWMLSNVAQISISVTF